MKMFALPSVWRLIKAFILLSSVFAVVIGAKGRQKNSRISGNPKESRQVISNLSYHKINASLIPRKLTTPEVSAYSTSQSFTATNLLSGYYKYCGLETVSLPKFDARVCRFALPRELSLALDGRFQNLAQHDLHATVYSAFIDYRVNLVKVVALVNKTTFDKFKCQLYYRLADSYNYSYVVVESTAGVRQMRCLYHNEFYAEISCAIDLTALQQFDTAYDSKHTHATPAAVAIVESSSGCARPHNLIKINTKPARSASQQGAKATFAVCGAPLHQRFADVVAITEYIEANKLLGASQFYFYDAGILSRVEKALKVHRLAYKFAGKFNDEAKDNADADAKSDTDGDSQSNENDESISAGADVQLLDWHLPFRFYFPGYHYYGQIAASADCLYRSMLKFDYLVYCDIDELLVPRRHKTWSELINFIDGSAGPAVAYVFSNYWFHPPANKSELRFVGSTYRKINPTGSFNRVKMIMNLSLVDMFEIHLLTSVMPEALSKNATNAYYEVPESIGMLHHYRSPPAYLKVNCSDIFDDHIRRVYGSKIEKSVARMMQNILKFA